MLAGGCKQPGCKPWDLYWVICAKISFHRNGRFSVDACTWNRPLCSVLLAGAAERAGAAVYAFLLVPDKANPPVGAATSLAWSSRGASSPSDTMDIWTWLLPGP